VRDNLTAGSWTGSTASCDAGSYSAAGISSTLDSINLYRELAGLPAVSDSAERNAAAQECALMQQAAGYLNHYPQPGAPCYTASGASAAGQSNLAMAESVAAVDMYMEDPGNSTTLGHRRWLLSNGLGPVGVGSTSGASCLWVLYGSGGGTERWTAWPPPGLFPYQAVSTSYSSIDATGWSIQSDSVNLNSATVTVRSGGQELPVAVSSLLANYGSSYAISIIPQGWSSQAGVVYEVELGGVSEAIAYEVEMVDCSVY